jgi:hypothetical protein
VTARDAGRSIMINCRHHEQVTEIALCIPDFACVKHRAISVTASMFLSEAAATQD